MGRKEKQSRPTWLHRPGAEHRRRTGRARFAVTSRAPLREHTAAAAVYGVVLASAAGWRLALAYAVLAGACIGWRSSVSPHKEQELSDA